MDLLKKYFPLSFKYCDTSSNLVIGIIVYLVIGIVCGVVIGVAALIPLAVIQIILRAISSIVGIYVLAGIVIEILLFAKVLK